MNKHTVSDLYQFQKLPLNAKISMTKRRIAEWVNNYGIENVYISFSGGKDSTVLLHIAREMYPNIKAMFCDTGLEYPEVRQFVKTFENVDFVKPKMGFKQVCEKYGFPLISKEVGECVYGARQYLTTINNKETVTTDGKTVPNAPYIADLLGIDRRINKDNPDYQSLRKGIIPVVATNNPNKNKGRFSKERWKFFLDAPFEISNRCCSIMKKNPVHKYTKETGRYPITAQMASESKLRTQKWLKNGCNAFSLKSPISNPMSFWTEQDVLLYIKTYNIPIASVYGDVIIASQISIGNFMDATEKEEFELDKPLLKTTGCERTGCVLCGFGCHLEKGEGRFQRLKKTHPKHYAVLDKITNNGITYREAINWINEHNGKGKIIKY